MFSQPAQATLATPPAQQQPAQANGFLVAQQPAAPAQGFLGAQQQQQQQQQPFLGTFGQQPRAQPPPTPPQQQQPLPAWGSDAMGGALQSAGGGAPGQLNGHMDVDTQQQQQQQWPYRFPAIDAGLVLYLCSRCKVRTHARFAKNWREVKMPRTGELLFSPGMLICGKCAHFNVNLRRHVEASS